jgi:hypothetical protein
MAEKDMLKSSINALVGDAGAATVAIGGVLSKKYSSEIGCTGSLPTLTILTGSFC